MQNRKLAGATVLSLALPGLIASLAVMPAANANISSDAGDGNLSSGNELSSEATMEQQCKWVLIGAPSSITLSPTTPGAEYNGNRLELGSDLASDISIHSTGNLDGSIGYDSFEDCAFFDNIFKPTATLTIGDTNFTASVGGDADTGMDFSVTESNSLDFTFTLDSTNCDADWTTKAETLSLSSTAAGTILDLDLSKVTSPVTSETNNDKCKLSSGNVKINIPEGKNPEQAGADYTFSGPTLTTALSTASS